MHGLITVLHYVPCHFPYYIFLTKLHFPYVSLLHFPYLVCDAWVDYGVTFLVIFLGGVYNLILNDDHNLYR